MNTKSLAILGGATLLVTLLAYATLRQSESAVEPVPSGGKVFPMLAERVNDAAKIELKRSDGTTTIAKQGEIWGLVEKNGFPVEMASVRKCLIALVAMTTAEEKTADPAQYGKLGVDDPATGESTATLLTIRDMNDAVIASLIVGKERQGKSFTGTHQVYVRKPDEARSWLANGDLGLHEKATDWLDKKILVVERERVRAVEVNHAEGETVLVDRDKPETNDFTLHDVPEGKEVSYPSAPSSLGSALEWLYFEDVVPSTEVDVKQEPTSTAKFSCFDGLTVTVTTKNIGDKTYARFEVAYETPPESAGPPGPDASDGSEPVETEKPAKKSREDVEKEVAELDTRLGAWTFVIPSYHKSSFQKAKSELLKDAAPAWAGEETEEDPAVPGEPDVAPIEDAPPPPDEDTLEPEATPPGDGGR
jgi:hypothetical protein